MDNGEDRLDRPEVEDILYGKQVDHLRLDDVGGNMDLNYEYGSHVPSASQISAFSRSKLSSTLPHTPAGPSGTVLHKFSHRRVAHLKTAGKHVLILLTTAEQRATQPVVRPRRFLHFVTAVIFKIDPQSMTATSNKSSGCQNGVG